MIHVASIIYWTKNHIFLSEEPLQASEGLLMPKLSLRNRSGSKSLGRRLQRKSCETKGTANPDKKRYYSVIKLMSSTLQPKWTAKKTRGSNNFVQYNWHFMESTKEGPDHVHFPLQSLIALHWQRFTHFQIIVSQALTSHLLWRGLWRGWMNKWQQELHCDNQW